MALLTQNAAWQRGSFSLAVQQIREQLVWLPTKQGCHHVILFSGLGQWFFTADASSVVKVTSHGEACASRRLTPRREEAIKALSRRAKEALFRRAG